MTDEANDDTVERITRVIDFRIPLPWLVTGSLVIAWALISMYFTLNQLVRDVADLQITVKSGNSQAVTLAGELALLRYRVETLESDRRAVQAAAAKPTERNGR